MNRKPLDLKPAGENLKIRAARLYSDIFSPPSVYAIFAFIIAWSDLPFWKGSLHAAIFGTLTSLLPLVYIILQLKRGKVSDIHLSKPSERNIPYILSILGAGIAFLGLRTIGSSELFLNFTLIIIIGLSALTIISIRWLISAHTASVTAVTVVAGYVFNGTTALVLSPLILTTFFVRYYLKRHTFGELISGVILGVFVVLGSVGLGLLQ